MRAGSGRDGEPDIESKRRSPTETFPLIRRLLYAEDPLLDIPCRARFGHWRRGKPEGRRVRDKNPRQNVVLFVEHLNQQVYRKRIETTFSRIEQMLPKSITR